MIVRCLVRKITFNFILSVYSWQEIISQILKDNLTTDNTNSGGNLAIDYYVYFSEVIRSMFSNFNWQWRARAGSYQLKRAKFVHLLLTRYSVISH